MQLAGRPIAKTRLYTMTRSFLLSSKCMHRSVELFDVAILPPHVGSYNMKSPSLGLPGSLNIKWEKLGML